MEYVAKGSVYVSLIVNLKVKKLWTKFILFCVCVNDF